MSLADQRLFNTDNELQVLLTFSSMLEAAVQLNPAFYYGPAAYMCRRQTPTTGEWSCDRLLYYIYIYYCYMERLFIWYWVKWLSKNVINSSIILCKLNSVAVDTVWYEHCVITICADYNYKN